MSPQLLTVALGDEFSWQLESPDGTVLALEANRNYLLESERRGELPRQPGVSAPPRGLHRDGRSTPLTRNAPAKRRRALVLVT